jgi:putative intracellular protease/amidase
MQIAILLYDKFTALDAIGPYQVLAGLPGASVVFVAEQAGPVADDTGMLSLMAQSALSDVSHPDILLVPGSPFPGISAQLKNGPVHEWLRAADVHTSWTTSVCTGALILAAAGLLAGRRATTHWTAHDQLAIQLMLEYDPQPPYSAGSPQTAPPDLVARLRRASRVTVG